MARIESRVGVEAPAAGFAVTGSLLDAEVGHQILLPAAMVDQFIWVANRPAIVTDVRLVYATAESTAATLTLQLTKDTGTNAPGAGTDLLATAFNCKATANTVQVGALITTLATLTLAQGDRLGIDFSAAATELAGLMIAVALRRV